jgi:hypothetical protein
MRTVSALLAGLAALAAPAASSPTLPAAPSIVRADGQVVAALVPGNGTRCAQIVVWRLGHAPKTIRTHSQCGDRGVLPGRVSDLALAGTTVAWQETGGGNNREYVVYEASPERPTPVLKSYAENGSGAAGNPGGNYTGGLAGHGGLIVYASWTHCDPLDVGYARPCSTKLPDVYAQTLKRIGGGVLRRGPDVLDPVWVDAGRVLIRHADGSLLLLDGPVARAFPATAGLLGAAVQGRQLVTLTRTALAVYDAQTAKLARSFRLAPAARTLEDLQGAIAVLGRSGTTHLVRLADGRGVTYPRAAPAGLAYASGRRLVFVPRAAVLRRFAPAG